MKLHRKFLASALGAAALLTAAPAHAGYVVIYYGDYWGGTQVGGIAYNNCGNVVAAWGVQTDLIEYAWIDIAC